MHRFVSHSFLSLSLPLTHTHTHSLSFNNCHKTNPFQTSQMLHLLPSNELSSYPLSSLSSIICLTCLAEESIFASAVFDPAAELRTISTIHFSASSSVIWSFSANICRSTRRLIVQYISHIITRASCMNLSVDVSCGVI